MSSILPYNATPLERDLEVDRLEILPVEVDTIWDPDRAPPAFLPWLAWALSVDVWDPAWSERRKRRVIRESWAVHRHKGTAGAVRRALDAVGVPAQLVEWWEEGGAPHTFRVLVDVRELMEAGQAFDAALLSSLRRHIDPVKPVRSHYSVAAFYGVDGEFFAGAALVTAARISVFPLLPREWSGSGTLEVAGVLGMNARLDVLAIV